MQYGGAALLLLSFFGYKTYVHLWELISLALLFELVGYKMLMAVHNGPSLSGAECQVMCEASPTRIIQLCACAVKGKRTGDRVRKNHNPKASGKLF